MTERIRAGASRAAGAIRARAVGPLLASTLVEAFVDELCLKLAVGT